MAGTSGFTAQPLTPGYAVNWVFLIELLVCGILVLFFVFYFNRLFATLVSYGLRAYTWHKFKVYIDIQALQLSLLGGRLFFKGVRYHGENETVFIHSGHITWRYWLRIVKQVDYTRFGSNVNDHGSISTNPRSEDANKLNESAGESGGVKKESKKPCRIAVHLSGLEWFIYNRTPAYEGILKASSLVPEANAQGEAPSYVSGNDTSMVDDKDILHRTRRLKKRTRASDLADEGKMGMSNTSDEDSLSEAARRRTMSPDERYSTVSLDETAETKTDTESLSFLSFLPVLLECNKGAIILGNENTKVLLTSTFDSIEGKIDAGTAGPLDLYRQIFDFDITHPVIQIRPNPDFKATQAQAAERLADEDRHLGQRHRHRIPKWHFQRKSREAWKSLRGLVPYFRRSVESFRLSPNASYDEVKNHPGEGYSEGPWLGLTRYLDETTQDDHEAWGHVDYARFSTILDCPSMSVNYYWDVPGTVSLAHRPVQALPHVNISQRVNGSDQPGYGMDIVIRGGTINYGPWADRARAEIQSIFFPNGYQDAVLAKPLKPGEKRLSTTFNMRIDVEEETTIRIPTRESSKDHQWRGRADAVRGATRVKRSKSKRHGRQKKEEKNVLGPDIRPFGWFSLSIDPNSTVSFDMDMYAGEKQYETSLSVDLKGTKMTSSVNHALLWRCGPQKVSCDLPNPVGWNTLREWTFGIHSEAFEFFILRDHMFLLTDLINDWSTGPPAEYLTFVPFKYHINLDFSDLKLYLNTNDANIIDDPSDPADNTFFIIGGQSLKSKLEIPLDKFRPNSNSITFQALLRDARLDLTTPLWNTLNTFMDKQPLATLEELSIGGSYNYNSATSPSLTDSLMLDLKGMAPKFYLHGVLIHHFMKVRENYFGENIHFRTLAEYQEHIATNAPPTTGDSESPKKDNDLDVILSVQANQGSVILPGNLYSRKENIQLDILLAEADMRFTNYYMDLDARFSPIEASIETITSTKEGETSNNSNAQLFIDGLEIFGHRLFGLPPHEPTYVCNWDFHVGKILGECSTNFLRILSSSIQALIFTIDDTENALPLPHGSVLHDVTFLRAYIDSIRIWLLVGDSALLIGTGSIEVSLSDWADTLFSERINVKAPDILIAAVEPSSTNIRREPGSITLPTSGAIATSLNIKVMGQKPDFAKKRALQFQHVLIHDQRTHRVPWMTGSSDSFTLNSSKHPPAAMAVPTIPPPIVEHGGTGIEHEVVRKSSFLSIDDMRRGRSQGQALKRSKSTQSVKHQPNLRVPSNAHSNHSDGSRHESNFQGSLLQPTPVTYASPWSPPHFTLAAAEPDLQELPHIANLGEKKRSNDDAPPVTFTIGEDENTTHSSIIFSFEKGLFGFITPAIFNLVAGLSQEMAPVHPVDILDNLQKDCISKIVQVSKLSSNQSKIMDLQFKLPCVQLRAINRYNSNRDGFESLEHDIYTATMQDTQCTVRLSEHQSGSHHNSTLKESMWLQANFEELAVTVSGKSTVSQRENAAFRAFIKDAVFWLANDDQFKSSLQIRSIDVATWSREVGFLAALIHRSIQVSDDVATTLKDASPKYKHALKHLIYHLTLEGREILDPPFLTRPSYVLRTVGDHLRTSDSWKIISRLRYIYDNLGEDSRSKAIQCCSNPDIESPADAQAHVVSSFDQWRAWDLAQVDRTLVMEMIWGSQVNNAAPSSTTVQSSVSIGSTRFLLDPGPKQNEITLGDLGLLASSETQPDGRNPRISRQSVTVRTYFSKVAIRLNWEICDLLEDTLSFFAESTPNPKPGTVSEIKDTTSQRSITDVHLVFGTDLGIFAVDTVNLKVAMVAKGLKGSILHAEHNFEGGLPNSSALLGASSASTDISHQGRILMAWRLMTPNFYGSFIPSAKDSSSADLKVAANCQKIHYSTKVDIPTLAEISDKVVQDEVAFVVALLKRFKRPAPPVQVSTNKPNIRLRYSVALFLDNYKIIVSLLPSLTYTISGEIARTAITPQGKDSLRVDFDLQRNSHSFHSTNNLNGNAFSTLKMPPLNGRVDVTPGAEIVTVAADVSIEPIVLDGTALGALFDAAGRPEIVNVLDELKINSRRTKSRLDSLLGSEQSSSESVNVSPVKTLLLYTASFTLAGLSVHTSAPMGPDKTHSSADLDFSLALVRVKLHNQRDGNTEAFAKPQYEVDLRQVSLDLLERHHGRTSSYGSVKFGVVGRGRTESDEASNEIQAYRLASSGLNIDLFPRTAALITSIAAHVQERIKALDISHESRPVRTLRRFTRPEIFDYTERHSSDDQDTEDSDSTILLDSTFAIELALIQVNWIVPDETPLSPGRQPEDLVLSVRKIDLTTKRENSARLAIGDLQLQMVPKAMDKRRRTMNSALLPEVVFNVAYFASRHDWRLAFQAAGKALDLRLTSDFILPASTLQTSIASASQVLRQSDVFTSASAPQNEATRPHMFGKKRLSSLLVDADFAGAVVAIQERPAEEEPRSAFSLIKGTRRTKTSRYEQFVQGDTSGKATLRAPGVAFKIEFQDRGDNDPSLIGEIKVAASKNILNPTVVPLVLEISSSVKEAVGESGEDEQGSKIEPPKLLTEGAKSNGDPSAILGRTRLNLGLWVQRQEFSLTCHPIARVAATACFDDIFMTINTVQSVEQTRFFSLLLSFNNLSASVQHVYSRESTASFDVQSITVSLINSKHISSTSGISAVVNISPMKTIINAKQVQDFLLFREIWYPPEIRRAQNTPPTTTHPESQAFIVQRYQQVASTTAFPLNTVISIAELGIEVDLGQGLGKTTFSIFKLWTSSRKSSDLEHNLCLGFEKIAVNSTGRMSGTIELSNFRVRTSIRWPSEEELHRTPLISASAGFDGLRVKSAFDYQPFLVADITTFEFLMFNVREQGTTKDRLVGILEGDKIQVFCTATSASLGLALYQAFLRLVQEKQAAYESSIRELDRFLRRRSAFPTSGWPTTGPATSTPTGTPGSETGPFGLHTDVVVNLNAVNIGAFPNSFFDNQIFKLEASNAEARFRVAMKHGRTHSGLGLTLGQLRVALSSVNRSTTQAFGEVSVDEVVKNATGSRGGTILKVPKVIAQMETWQTGSSNNIDYIFKSKFEGKVDVGWNYSRISFIRGMWAAHSRALASRLGKPLPQSAVQITGGPKLDDPSGHQNSQEKITAVVNVPQSRFEYTALEPPIIETPQLRDMGEATPPLEWIGLHRDRLPNLTHQIIIVTLLEVAKEVEDAYTRILGAS